MQMHQHAANKHVIKPAAFPSPFRQDSCAGDKAAAATRIQGCWVVATVNSVGKVISACTELQSCCNTMVVADKR